MLTSSCPSTTMIFPMFWQGDPVRFRTAFEPWRQAERIAVNIDLGENGVLSKIGIEVFSRWRHPLLVDKAIARLANFAPTKRAADIMRGLRLQAALPALSGDGSGGLSAQKGNNKYKP